MWKEFSYYQIYSSQFDAEECRRIIDLHRADDGVEGRLSAYGGSVVRDSHLWWIYRTPATEWLFRRIGQVVARYNRSFRFEIDPLVEAAQLTRYSAGQRYDWHLDIGDAESSLRKISVVVELSSPASRRGGGLEVFHGDAVRSKVPLQRGDVACFPSFILHRARNVRRGTRWSLVLWIKGPTAFR